MIAKLYIKKSKFKKSASIYNYSQSYVYPYAQGVPNFYNPLKSANLAFYLNIMLISSLFFKQHPIKSRNQVIRLIMFFFSIKLGLGRDSFPYQKDNLSLIEQDKKDEMRWHKYHNHLIFTSL